ncbi:ATP-binding protein [Umezawaea beigongshangensis]|uniref:ATP-binding protein n=1 Tax=Umezawaea beigongshangensis TaxID=2780383 RepID=UPI0018F1B04D|nr:ATP-binding protein [Umezawaea beigongshangensis]
MSAIDTGSTGERRFGLASSVQHVWDEFPDGIESGPASRMRAQLAEVLAGCHPEQVMDAQLVLSELVENAYEHGRRPLFAKVTVSRGLARFDVADTSTRTPCATCAERAQHNHTGGRGMLLISSMCRRWGVTVTPGEGKTVWAELVLGDGDAR